MHDIQWYDIVRIITSLSGFYALFRWLGARHKILGEATDRLKNLYYTVVMAHVTLSAGLMESFLRNRPVNWSIWLSVLTVAFGVTSVTVGKPMDFFRHSHPEHDSGFKSGSEDG